MITRLQGTAPAQSWSIELQLLRAEITEPAATSKLTCDPCDPEQAAKRLKEETAKLLADGLLRPHGKLQLTTEPAAATLQVAPQSPQPAPLTAALWAGSWSPPVPRKPPVRRSTTRSGWVVSL